MRLLLLSILLAAGCGAPAPANSCTDSAKDGDETDVDCGGSCRACALGKICLAAADCQTGPCVNNLCGGGGSPDAGGGVDSAAAIDATVPDLAIADLATAPDLFAGCMNNQQCASLSHAEGMCGPGNQCVVTSCDPGYADCDGQGGNGCEVYLQTDINNCGKCAAACGVVVNGMGACKAGACIIGGCTAGFANCDGLFATGCSTSVLGDVKSCGTCGRVCMAPNGTPGCANGACIVASCNPGFADCNMNAADGCEAAIADDPMNCGGCMKACMTPPNSVAACANSTCAVGMCKFGYADCDHNLANGCEVKVAADVANCGACAIKCPAVANATIGCDGGVCGIGMCNALYGDCDMNPANGCEKSLAMDPMNCGMCGKVCNFANATGACLKGQCGITKCDQGFADCDKNGANGCESSLDTDPMNCGQCGVVCPMNLPNCAAGVCVAAVRVLVVGASKGANVRLTDLQTALKGTGAFSAVDVFDGNAGTPTLQQLQAYQAVLVYSDSGGFMDPASLGDHLAAYFDGGGSVVVAPWINDLKGNSSLAGAFAANGYMLIASGTAEGAASSLGTINEPQSPLVKGVKTFTASYRGGSIHLAQGAVVVAQFADGGALIVRGVVKGRNRADVNFMPIPADQSLGDGWMGDGAILLKNALLYH